MLGGAAIWLVTKPWFPRVSEAALGMTCVGLGALALAVALEAFQQGVFKAVVASRIIRHDVYLAREPFGFWVYFALFAVPGALLVVVPIYIALANLVSWLRRHRPFAR
jgi:hypothetical protein